MRPGRGGFTLIELMITIGILALGTAVAVPALLQLGQEDDLTRATRRMEALFHFARDSAIHAGAPVTVVIDSITGLVWLDLKAPVEMVDDLSAITQASPFAIPDPGTGGGRRALSRFSDQEPGASLELPPSVTMHLPRARARFTFVASGAAHADSLTLSSPFGSRVILLNPWTGDVIIR